MLRETPIGPVRRLILIEAAGGIAFASVALPLSGPEVELPDWIQLLGSGLLIAMWFLTLHTWRGLIGPRAWAGATALRRQIYCERRLRRGAVIYSALLVLLTPVPPTWTRFWFATTVLTAVASALAPTVSITTKYLGVRHVSQRR
ncbi:hypothetical protein GCM10009764_40270 [Nocardia ninae]|uniref:Uncharacterized protein n=1 Tax=Nocardia ninae NBRC 108245 TaxID=1210091 RepID=A0A511MHP8_9NOCA|nr:hypothetical protein NN4_47230 [Nocardia ninae NBRC 108245]